MDRRLLAGLILAASGWFALRQSRRKRSCATLGLTYVQRLTGGAEASEELPMVVFLHSRGARPEGFASFAQRVKGKARVLFPGGPHVRGARHSWMTVGSKSAQFEDELQVSGEKLASFIQQATRCLPTRGRPVVTGTSQGGHMAYYMSNQYPGLVRGAVAIAGYLPPRYWNRDMAKTYGGHGIYDDVVPYARTKQFWDEMGIEHKAFPVGHTTSGMGPWWGARVNELLYA